MSFIPIILCLFFLILIIWLMYHCRSISQDTILLITGGVGMGKTSTGLNECLKSFRKKRFRYYFKTKFLRKKNVEKPFIYCNMPLYGVEYKSFTLEHLLREKRFEYDSVIFLNEISLIADSMLAYNIGKDKAREYVNKQLQLFCKLIRHETLGKGITLILDTQNPNDMAMGGDRCLSSCTQITKSIKWLPFFRLIQCRVMTINVQNVQNNVNESEDVSNVDFWRLVPKSIFRKYNSYCYEFLSSDLPIIPNSILYNKKNMKRKDFYHLRFVIPTLNNYAELNKNNADLGVKSYFDIQKEIRESEMVHK